MILRSRFVFFFFFFNDTATTEIYTLSLHDALPIWRFFSAQLEREFMRLQRLGEPLSLVMMDVDHFKAYNDRSEEHTSELQSPCNLVCRLLLEKKKSIKSGHRRRTRLMSGADGERAD